MKKPFSSWNFWSAGRLGGAGLTVVFLFLVVAWSSGTASAAGKKRVGLDVNGSPAGPIRSAVSDVLKHHGYEVTSADLSGDSDDAIAGAAKKGKLAAIIVGDVKDGGKRAKLRVYGAAGDLIGEGSWTEHKGIKKLAADVERTLWARIGGALSKANAGGGGAGDRSERVAKASAPVASKEAEPAEEQEQEKPEKSAYSRSEESEKADKSNDADEDASARKAKKKKKKKEADEDAGDDASGPAATALDLGVGVRFISRSLDWANNPNKIVLPYSMGLAPALGLTLAWYPAAHFGGGWPSNIGLVASAEYLVAYESVTKSDGKHYPTKENDYWVGLRGRLPLGALEAALTVGGGQHAFVFLSGSSSDRATIGTLPDVAYTYVRAAADFRIALPANLSLLLGGGYRYVLGAGKKNYLLEAPAPPPPGFFPDAKVSGFDVTAGVAYRLLSFLEGRASFDLRRYAIKTNTSGAQPAISSGTDQTLGISIMAAFLLDGHQGGGAARTRAATPPAESEKAEKSGSKEDEAE